MDVYDNLFSELMDMTHLAGMRLKKLELLNWGTFNGRIFTFRPNGESALISGPSGSGKSTIVDAIQTLLLDGRDLSFNQAADAKKRERDVHTYVLGRYGQVGNEENRSIANQLRDYNTVTVLLATFKEEQSLKTVTIARSFQYTQPSREGLKKRFFIANQERSIQDHVLPYLKNNVGKENFEWIGKDYTEYYERYSRVLGGITRHGLRLFREAIYMKQVKDITGFVRDFILEKDDTIHIDVGTLLDNFESLNRSYEETVIARNQIKALEPIVAKYQRWDANVQEKDYLSKAEDKIKMWAPAQKVELGQPLLMGLQREQALLEGQLQAWKEKIEELDKQLQELHRRLGNEGGSEMDRLRSAIELAKKELKKREIERENYKQHATVCELPVPNSETEFVSVRMKQKERQEEYKCLREEQQNQAYGLKKDMDSLQLQMKEEREEIDSLKTRTNNLPLSLVRLQAELCQELQVQPDDIPFAGALIDVKDLAWEGAIERLFHSFSQSLLVPRELYIRVSSYIDSHHLKGKIVYYKVDLNSAVSEDIEITGHVLEKIEVKEDSRFRPWLLRHIGQRLNYQCCETVSVFQDVAYGLTKMGQIKAKNRHEKDDRHRIDDRSRYYLGFSNKKKLEQLENLWEEHRILVMQKQKDWDQLAVAQQEINKKGESLAILQDKTRFEDIDCVGKQCEIDGIRRELDRLQHSTAMKEIQRQIEEVRLLRQQTETSCEGTREACFRCATRVEKMEKELRAAAHEINHCMPSYLEECNAVFNQLCETYGIEVSIDKADTLRSIDRAYNRVESTRNKKRMDLADRIGTESAILAKEITQFKRDFNLHNIDGTTDSGPECMSMLRKLKEEKLPAFEKKFKEQLQATVENHVAVLYNKLEDTAQQIEDKINDINETLRGIDFNRGHYITMVPQLSSDTEIIQFKKDMKACFALYNDEEKNEEKYMAARTLIERLRVGLDPHTRSEWFNKVTDVRQWWKFTISERDKATDQEVERYTDTAGKSGGQKEKLAYTILAAGFLYNYQLSERVKSREDLAFRTIVIDEAFLRSSEEAAEYALKLFDTLRFQMIIITPGTHTPTITPFMSSAIAVEQKEDTHESVFYPIEIQYVKSDEGSH